MRVLGHDLEYVGTGDWQTSYVATGAHRVSIRFTRRASPHRTATVYRIEVSIDAGSVAAEGADERELLSRIHRGVTRLIQRTQGINP